MKALRNFAILLALAFTLGWLAGGPDEEEAVLTTYCQMVAEHHDSNGERGWPDYRGTFATECNADGTTQEDN